MAQKPQTTVQVSATAPPLSQAQQADVIVKNAEKKVKSASAQYGMIFLVVLIVAFLVFYLLKPSIVMKRVGDKVIEEVDFVRVLIASVIVAVIITLIVWIFRAFIMKP